jgi:hypothetical protein
MRRVVLLSSAIALALLAGCGDSKGSYSSGAAATSTTVKSSTATTQASATTQSSSANTAAARGSVTNACTLVTLDEVSAATKQTVIADAQPGAKTSCVYDTRATGIFFMINLGTLTKADQPTFDTLVKGQDSGSTIMPVTGIGDGTASLVKHHDNVKVYARKGTNRVAVTVFNGAADPTANAQQLIRTALGRL